MEQREEDTLYWLRGRVGVRNVDYERRRRLRGRGHRGGGGRGRGRGHALAVVHVHPRLELRCGRLWFFIVVNVFSHLPYLRRKIYVNV